MKKRLSTLNQGLLLALGSTALIAPVWAAEEEKAERVEVVGSHIKRTDLEGPSPVISLTRDDIEKTGNDNLWQVLQKLTVTGSGSFSTLANNQDSSANGTAGISLRGFGANATLVLINGRRMAMSSFAQQTTVNFVDLNTIPVSAIERVEVLKDGASALYGSDAVAGVVNVVLRKNFDGLELNLGYGNTTDTDAGEQTASVLWGFGDNKSHGTMILDYFKQNALMGADRDFADSADQRDRGGDDYRSSTGNPGAWRPILPYTGGNPVANGDERYDAACPAAQRRGTRCAFDYGPYTTLFPLTERAGMVFMGQREIGDGLEWFSELSFQHNRSEAQGAAAPGTPVDRLVVKKGTRYNPMPDSDVWVTRYRVLGAGPRLWNITSDTSRFLTGLRGSIGDWDWETSATRSRSSATQEGTRGWVRADKLREYIYDGRLNPFGGASIANVLNDVTTHVTRTGDSSLTAVDARISGTLTTWSSGPVGLAAGVEHRNERVRDTPDRQFEEGNIVGTEAVSAAASRDQWSAYVETGLPLTEKMELQLALRHDNYDGFGGTTNPKVAWRWVPTDMFSLRASWGTGFRAPSLAQIGLGPSEESPGVRDTARCALEPNDPNACKSIEVSAVFEGNPALKAEKSESFNIGAVFEFSDAVSFSVDYWEIELEDKIDKPRMQSVVDKFGTTQNSTIVTRYAPAPGKQLGEIFRIFASFDNFEYQNASGIDFSLNQKVDLGGSNLKLSYNWSYLREFDDPLDHYAGGYEYPKHRLAVVADWERDAWTLSGRVNYIGSFDDTRNNNRTVSAMATVGVQAGYALSQATRLTFGVDNLFDEAAPFANSDGDIDATGYSTATHNPRGRFAYAKWNYRF